MENETQLLQNRLEYLEAERRLEVKQHNRRVQKLDAELATVRAKLAAAEEPVK